MIWQKIHPNRLPIGTAAWLAWLLFVRPSPLDPMWARGILLMAPLVIVPMATAVLARSASVSDAGFLGKIIHWQLPAALLFAVAFLMPNGWLSMLCVLPWAAVTFAFAYIGLRQLSGGAWRQGPSFAVAMGMTYLSVAGIWAIMERLGFYPFHFNPEIVFLTIVHFHYAGFTLPVLAGLAAKKLGGIFNQVACYLTVGAVGVLAIGITFTQLGLGTDWEMVSAWLMALSAAAVGWMHFRLALTPQYPLKTRMLWMMSALSLLGGMLLAALYGSRFLLPVDWLDIPMMRALHGTLNAVGFGFFAVAGWFLSPKTNLSAPHVP